MSLNKRPIVLASGSPRRKQLLEEAGFTITVSPVNADETYPENLAINEVAEFICSKKTAEARQYLTEDNIIITADSIVVLGQKIFGKPSDRNDAIRILAHLSGKKHTVYTGVQITDKHKTISFTGSSNVYFREFTYEEIEWYIDRFKPYDKAGSYAVQEWVGLCKISAIEGSYANIMGLPADLVYEGLKHFEGALLF
ncbi:MAG TPA: Maf family protein [Saprospiraceae bacterium]|nr:Maf family protein [Saprospiraceae bacterium]